MRLTIIRDDCVVGVDGVFRQVDLSKLPAGVAAVQWSGASGHVEIDGKPNESLKDIKAYQPFVDLWTAAEPPAPAPPTLDQLKADKIAEINAACRAEIVGGFVSQALGSPYTYDSQEEDQLNLIGAAGLGVDIPYRCADAAGIKAFRQHTAAQLRQVATDGAMVKLGALQKAANLKAQVAAAVTEADVAAVVWAI